MRAVLAPIAFRGTAVSIRVPRWDAPDLDQLQAAGMFSRAIREGLEAMVASRANLLITGATGVGTTTLLSVVSSRVPCAERIPTIEEVAGLRPGHPDHVALETR